MSSQYQKYIVCARRKEKIYETMNIWNCEKGFPNYIWMTGIEL